MIIKLGRTAIKYNTPKQDDFMVISCIPSSEMSPDKPTFIRSAQELRIYFGEEFPEYSYLVELLEMGVSLYLMGPASRNENRNLEDYVQLGDYADGFYTEGRNFNLNGYSIRPLPLTAPKGMIYRVISENGVKVGGPSGKYNEYVFLEEGWTDIRDLPQNTWINTDSQNNRDTLRLCEGGLFCHPKYKEEVIPSIPLTSTFYRLVKGAWMKVEGIWDSPEYIFNSLEELTKGVLRPKEGEVARIDILLDLSRIDPCRVDNDEDTLAFTIENRGFGPTDFIVLENTLYGNPPEGYTPEKIVPITSIDQFLAKTGWKLEEGKYLIPGELTSKVTYFSTLGLEPNWRKSQQLLTSWTVPILDFHSKTIGSVGPESWITVKTEDLEEKGAQRVTISRYEYSEVFEGSWIKGTTEDERLDYKISKESKLVKVVYHQGIPPEGEWVLRGGEGLMKEGKEKTLEFIFNSETPIDLFLSYGDLPQKSLLEYSKRKGCQCLIQNTGEDYRNNVIDPTNHLLFFYGEMYLFGVILRPAWYIWLRGLLTDVYSDTADNISYNSPAPEYDEDNKLCKDLKKYRSNYLMSSGLSLFYRRYTWMEDKETAFARFVLGKISRELEKNKWDFVGPQPNGNTIPAVKRVLNRIKNTFRMIRSIEIEDYDFYYRRNLIELTLETRVSDLPEKDITLEITLNYSK